MKKINISIIQPENYIHSHAFIELAELIYFSLAELGVKSNIEFNKIYTETKNIIIGCHLLDPNLIEQIPKSTIIVNTEQIYKDKTDWNKNIYTWVRDFEVWDYSEKNIQKLCQIGVNTAKLLKIGYQKELARLDNFKNKDIDILFYGTVNERRKEVLNKLIHKGLNVKKLFGVYGKERDKLIERSKVVINLHAYESQIFEIVRVFYLLTNSVAVVGEVNETTEINNMFLEGIYAANYDGLVDACIELVKSDELRKKVANNAFESISKFPQKEYTQKILNI